MFSSVKFAIDLRCGYNGVTFDFVEVSCIECKSAGCSQNSENTCQRFCHYYPI